jgi:uncharacterized protein (TIGR03437 family)
MRIFSGLFALTVCTGYLHAATLSAVTTPINLTCIQGQVCTATATTGLSLSSGSGTYSVSNPTVPWVTVTAQTDIVDATSPADGNITFTVTSAWTSLTAGFNSTSFTITSPLNGTLVIPVNLEVQNAAPSLLIEGGTNTLNSIPFLTGGAAPTPSLTVLSSNGTPVAFTVATVSATTPEGITAWLTPAAGSTSGIAYSWGTTLNFTVSAAATTTNAQAGDNLTGTITLTTATQTITVPLTIVVNAAAPTLTSISPSIVPLLTTGVAPGFVTLVLKGTNFVSTTGAQKTKVFVGTTAATSTQVLTSYVTVLSPQYLTVNIPYAATGIPFATAGATALVVGVANGAAPTTPVLPIQNLAVTAAPIISTVTSASAVVDLAAPKAAPYDILTIWGTNFCTLCVGTNASLVGAVDAYDRFPLFLSPDGTHKVTVIFSKPGTPATSLPGYILFATNNQINVAVPGGLATLNNTGVNVQVAYDVATPPASPAATATSAFFLLNQVAVNPGIFTIAASGQGQGAITDGVSFALNSSAAPGNLYVNGSTVGGTAAIFMTGLGVPTSVGTNVFTSSPTYFTNCLAPIGVVGTSSVAPTGYMGTVNTPFFASVTGTGYSPASGYVVPAWTSIDGAVINPAILQGNYAPCFATSYPTVTIGGASATVLSAGFVAGSVTGLYQINVEVPNPLASLGSPPQQYPVVVTVASVASQTGVTMWVNF